MIGGRQVGRRYVGGSRFHPRIVLISDGNLTPSECIIGNTNLPDLNTHDKKEETLVGTVLIYKIEHIQLPLAIDQFYLYRTIYTFYVQWYPTRIEYMSNIAHVL